jgi:hypothetical protein
MRKFLIIIACMLAVVMVAACEPSEPNAAQKEQQTQADSYKGLTETQPAESMDYSPGRDTAINWARHWSEQGKVSYVYLYDSVGHKIGYFILKGLPVSYCASLTPPDKLERADLGDYYGQTVRAAPAMDGLYYGAANCQQMYGFDALTGQYYEFTGGGSFNYILSDQPMQRLQMTPIGDATVEQVQAKD